MADKKYLDEFIKKMNLNNPELAERFIEAIRAGKNTTYHNTVSEAISLDDSWIMVLEGALFSMEKIAKNPRKFIVEEDLIVDVARARKTNAKTVRHLSSHSQFIQNIDEDGEVTPKKLLTVEMDEDIAIYENRFICSLLHRLIPFVETRYNDINDKMNSFDQSGVGIISNFKYGESEVDFKLDVKVKEPPHDTVLLERNIDLLERIKVLRRRLRVLQATEFIRFLEGKKPVRPPIMKTNLIKMNVDYQNCYKLWLYVSSYNFVGFNVSYQEKNLPLDSDYYDDLTVMTALGVQSMLANNVLNQKEYDKVPYSPLKEKKFKLLTAYKFEPIFNKEEKEGSEDIVNEYYFKTMRDELIKALKVGSVVEEKVLKMTFARFYKSISKINSEMYDDVIHSQFGKKRDLRLRTSLQKKDEAVGEQQLLLRRYHQLSQLRKEELEKSLRAESRELLKLEKLQADLDKERGKIKSKKEREQKKKERLKKINEKKAKAYENASEYEQELRDKEQERLDRIEEKKRLKREEAQRRRELKKLEELKEKYNDKD